MSPGCPSGRIQVFSCISKGSRTGTTRSSYSPTVSRFLYGRRNRPQCDERQNARDETILNYARDAVKRVSTMHATVDSDALFDAFLNA
jgi:hypothetical protein